MDAGLREPGADDRGLWDPGADERGLSKPGADERDLLWPGAPPRLPADFGLYAPDAGLGLRAPSGSRWSNDFGLREP